MNSTYTSELIESIRDNKAGRIQLQQIFEDVYGSMYAFPLGDILSFPLSGKRLAANKASDKQSGSINNNQPILFSGIDQIEGMLKAHGIIDEQTRQRVIELAISHGRIDRDVFDTASTFDQDKEILLFTTDLGMQIGYCRSIGSDENCSPVIEDLEDSPSCILHMVLRILGIMGAKLNQRVVDDPALTWSEKLVRCILKYSIQ